jgi:hypothetical protein
MTDPGPSPDKIFAQPPEKEGLAKYILLAAGGCSILLLIFGAIIWFVFRVTAGPVDIVNRQLNAISSGDVDKAYSYCSGAFKDNTNLEAFRNFVESYPILKSASEYSANNREISGNMATLKGSIKAKDGSSLPAEFRLTKENGAWKVQYISMSPSGIANQQSQKSQPRETQEGNPITKLIKPDEAEKEQGPDTGTGLRITQVNVEKESANNSSTIRLKFQVLGFRNDRSNGAARMSLVQDLKTFGPAGNLLQELSKDGIKELNESGSPQDYNYADFINTLTIPFDYPKGKYTARITVHDQISGGVTETTAEFLIP